MPRYFFNVHDGHDIPDQTGTVLPDLDAARREALRYTCELLGSLNAAFWEGHDWTLECSDEAGAILFRLCFYAVVAEAAGQAPPTSG